MDKILAKIQKSTGVTTDFMDWVVLVLALVLFERGKINKITQPV